METHNQVYNFLKKSRGANRQLEFSQLFTLSYMWEGEVESELVCCSGLGEESKDNHRFYIYSRIDKRSQLFKGVSQQQALSLCWYFPLSKEKYQMKVRGILVDDQGCHQEESLLKEYHSQWKNMDQQERNKYQGASPDTPKQELPPQEIDKFNSPDKIGVSSNYVLLVLVAEKVTHTIYHMPQVQADARKKYESLFSPYKRDQKFSHVYEHPAWKTTTLNP